jgi:organic hydroperoxide reductase OsmC/OhrA
MSDHHATISWTRTSDEFSKGRYSRAHEWKFDGGTVVPASPSPTVVPAPLSNPAAVDPEEAYVASVSSCHMLWFVDLARRKGFVVDSYEDNAVGIMTKTDSGSFWISQITLNPKVAYSGEKQPTSEDEKQLHHDAHKNCFIANSIKTEVVVAEN